MKSKSAGLSFVKRHVIGAAAIVLIATQAHAQLISTNPTYPKFDDTGTSQSFENSTIPRNIVGLTGPVPIVPEPATTGVAIGAALGILAVTRRFWRRRH